MNLINPFPYFPCSHGVITFYFEKQCYIDEPVSFWQVCPTCGARRPATVKEVDEFVSSLPLTLDATLLK